MTTVSHQARESMSLERFARVYRHVTLGVFAALAVFLAAFHSPGQMSVDSILALYGAMKGVAAGWDVTFLSAIMVWLGGGVIATSLFVAINCCLTYGCFAVLLTRHRAETAPRWRLALAFVLALNPLFMFYVGIVWKDVILATCAMVVATLLLMAANNKGHSRYLLLVLSAVTIAFLIPIRQQGILLAAPFSIVIAGLAICPFSRQVKLRAAIFFICMGCIVGCTLLFTGLQNKTIKGPMTGAVRQGLLTIRDYDIAGIIANTNVSEQDNWSEAAPSVKAEIRKLYSPERIDTIWHVPEIRGYFDNMGSAQGWSIWARGIEHHPAAYIRHRWNAMAWLLGLHGMKGCVAAYWGVYGLPDQVIALGLREEMDARAKLIGRLTVDLFGTPVFRNWFYALLLIAASIAVVFRLRGSQRWTAAGIAVAGWLYLLSFIPTTIACDFRYLYPVASVTSVLCIYLLTSGGPDSKHPDSDLV